jgi:hypothetical protein
MEAFRKTRKRFLWLISALDRTSLQKNGVSLGSEVIGGDNGRRPPWGSRGRHGGSGGGPGHGFPGAGWSSPDGVQSPLSLPASGGTKMGEDGLWREGTFNERWGVFYRTSMERRQCRSVVFQRSDRAAAPRGLFITFEVLRVGKTTSRSSFRS